MVGDMVVLGRFKEDPGGIDVWRRFENRGSEVYRLENNTILTHAA